MKHTKGDGHPSVYEGDRSMYRPGMHLPIALVLLIGLLISPHLASAAAGGAHPPLGTAASHLVPFALPRTSAAAPTYLYTCFWKKQAVTLTPVKLRKVNTLRDAKRAGACTGFDTGNPAFASLVGKTIKVYTAPAEYKANLVAYQPKKGKSTAFGTWTFSAKAVIVQKTTDVLPASTVMDITPPAAGKPLDTSAPTLTLTFKTSDPKVSTLKAGSVIVSGITPLTPYGMMRKVTSITTGASGVTVDTVPAQLSDVFNQATIDIHTALSQALLRGLAQEHSPRLRVHRLRDQLSLCPTFPSLSIGSDGVQQGASKGGLGSLTLGGSYCLTAGDLQYQESVNSVTPSLGWTFGGGENLHLTYRLEGGVVAYHGDLLTLLDQKLGVIPLEEFGVPVEIVPQVTSKLTADLNFSGYVSGGVGYSGTYTAGLSCGITGCSPESSNDGGFNTDKTLSGGTASFTLALGFSVSFLIDGVFGPGIGASVYATASAGTGIADCFSVVAGIKATLSLNFQLFGKYNWTGSWDIIKSENPLPLGASACVPKIASFKADQTSPIDAGKMVTFTATTDTPIEAGTFHILIVDAVLGKTLQDCTSGDTCTFEDTEPGPKELVLKAETTDPGGAVLDTSDPLSFQWKSHTGFQFSGMTLDYTWTRQMQCQPGKPVYPGGPVCMWDREENVHDEVSGYVCGDPYKDPWTINVDFTTTVAGTPPYHTSFHNQYTFDPSTELAASATELADQLAPSPEHVSHSYIQLFLHGTPDSMGIKIPNTAELSMDLPADFATMRQIPVPGTSELEWVQVTPAAQNVTVPVTVKGDCS